MPFTIRMGIPEMEKFWADITAREAENKLDKNEFRTFKKLLKSFYLLSINPKHPLQQAILHPIFP